MNQTSRRPSQNQRARVKKQQQKSKFDHKIQHLNNGSISLVLYSLTFNTNSNMKIRAILALILTTPPRQFLHVLPIQQFLLTWLRVQDCTFPIIFSLHFPCSFVSQIHRFIEICSLLSRAYNFFVNAQIYLEFSSLQLGCSVLLFPGIILFVIGIFFNCANLVFIKLILMI